MSQIHNHDEVAELEMKKALRPQIENQTTYWQSLEQWSKDPEVEKLLQTEFVSSPLRDESADDSNEGWARRDFLKLMGASIALSATACVRRPVQKIVPYNKQPEEITLGVANYYTSSFQSGSEGLGILVRTKEGRPIKIEGNPDFPLNKGAVSVRSQGFILSLYDPERLREPKKNIFNEKRSNKDTIGVTWEKADEEIVAQLKKGGVAVLTGASSSPSSNAAVSDFVQGFKAERFTWEPLSWEDVRNGQRVSYGDDLIPHYRFDQARFIVSVDADFLGTWIQPVAFTRQFAAARKNIETMPRLISFDSEMSLTASNADIRYRIKPSQQLHVVLGLLKELAPKSSFAGNADLKRVLDSVATTFSFDSAVLKKIAEDLWENRGQSLVVAGGMSTMTQDSLSLQIAVNLLNSVLENEGKTVLGKSGNPHLKASSEELENLIKKMESGSIKTLIIHGTNPCYAASQGERFCEAMKKVEIVITTSSHFDEVAHHSHYILPDDHAMEKWGDAEFAKGLYSIQQPTIRPMYSTRSFEAGLMNWAFSAEVGPQRLRDYETFYDYTKYIWKTEIHPSVGKGSTFEDFWAQVLQKGFAGEMTSSSARSFKSEALGQLKLSATSSSMEIVVHPTIALGDGALANVAWLQELPHPVTKIVWDNYASISLATAEKMGLKEGNVVSLTVNGFKVELPVHIQPGLHDEVVAVAIGYGRKHGGKVGTGIGQNIYPFGRWDAGSQTMIFSGQPVDMKKTTRHEKLACVQMHHSMEGRQIVVEATLEDYKKQKDAGIHKHPVFSMWSGHQYNGHKWGMAVDLNTCTGCSACVISCQSENNIPVVGKKYVLQGREMHWLRIDRYYSGSPNDPKTVYQPVMCQHCDNAPCETVCPVLATVHSSEGLNEMVYNRCVGTRYCANNCPYKVRRFNWFNYAKLLEKPMHMAHNPDVTPRIRGVMEKCTFCVQKIKEGKNKAKLEKRALKDGEIKTACQTACPTDAIVFGDLNDPESAVSKKFKNEPRAYALLEEWHAAPAVRYLTKIRNNGLESAPHGKDSAHKGDHA